jgi:hypothetical protein
MCVVMCVWFVLCVCGVCVICVCVVCVCGVCVCDVCVSVYCLSFSCESYGMYKYSGWVKCRIWMFKQVVHLVTTVPKRIKKKSL